MTGPGHEVDPGVLDGVASILRSASADLDSVGNSMTGTPDAGDGTAAIAGIIARIVDNAGQLVTGAAAAGDDVTSANSTYQKDDAAAGDDVQRAGGG